MVNHCKKCNTTISKEDFPLDWQSHYCDKCVNEFEKAIEEGAIVIRRRTQRESNVFPYEIYGKNIKAETPEGINQVQAIKLAKKLVLRNNDKILFNYEPHGSMWFLEDYLEGHPKIKEDVERIGFFQKYLENTNLFFFWNMAFSKNPINNQSKRKK